MVSEPFRSAIFLETASAVANPVSAPPYFLPIFCGRCAGASVFPYDAAFGGGDVDVVVVDVLPQFRHQLVVVDFVSEHPFYLFYMGC